MARVTRPLCGLKRESCTRSHDRTTGLGARSAPGDAVNQPRASQDIEGGALGWVCRGSSWEVSIPGVVVSKIDVGGSDAWNASGIAVRGSGIENKYMVDGMDVSSPSGTATSANFFQDRQALVRADVARPADGAIHPRRLQPGRIPGPRSKCVVERHREGVVADDAQRAALLIQQHAVQAERQGGAGGRSDHSAGCLPRLRRRDDWNRLSGGPARSEPRAAGWIRTSGDQEVARRSRNRGALTPGR